MTKVYIKLSYNLYKYFKKLLTHNKEYSGALNYEYKNNIYYLELNNYSTVGNIDTVKPVIDDVTYHTHPNIAYTKYNTVYGWPSTIDYVVLMQSFQTMKLHIVVAKEGLWCICFHNDWIKYRSQCKEKHVISFIKNSWTQINKKTTEKWCNNCSFERTLLTYLKKINNMRYELNHRKSICIFKVCFKKWV